MSALRKLGWARSLGLAAIATLVALAPSAARAEGPATPTGKGIAGGILLGAEVVMIPIAIGGISDAWPYPVFGALGAGAGAVGGWGVEQSGSTAASVYMLAGGMALVIPTLVAVLNVTVYNTEDEEEEPSAEGGGSDVVQVTPPSAQPGATPGAAPATPTPATPGPAEAPKTSRSKRHIPLAIVGVDKRGVRPGIPAVELYQLYNETEIAQFGVQQGTEVRVPVVRATF
jgi:hypothetical protein